MHISACRHTHEHVFNTRSMELLGEQSIGYATEMQTEDGFCAEIPEGQQLDEVAYRV